MKAFADDNFKFDENGKKLSEQVENTVGKGEIARYGQFLLYPQCFQETVSQRRQKVSLCGNGLRSQFLKYGHCLGIYVSQTHVVLKKDS